MPQGNIGPLKKFLSNPLLGGIGLIGTFLGIILAIYFGTASNIKVDLHYYEYPEKTIVFNSDEASDLDIFFNNSKVEKDITAGLISFWNEGKLAAENTSILSPFQIYTEPSVPIISANLRSITRKETLISIDTTRLPEGIIPLSWRILEKGDGCQLQIVYFGNTKVKIKIRGIIKGQKLVTDSSIRGKHTSNSFIWISIAFPLMFLFITLPLFKSYRHLYLSNTKKKIILRTFLYLVILVGMLTAIYVFYTSNLLEYRPPF